MNGRGWQARVEFTAAFRGDFSRDGKEKREGYAPWKLWIAYLPMKGIEDTWGATHGDGNPKPPTPGHAASRQTCLGTKDLSKRERRPLFRPRSEIIFLLMHRSMLRVKLRTIMKRVTRKSPPQFWSRIIPWRGTRLPALNRINSLTAQRARERKRKLKVHIIIIFFFFRIAEISKELYVLTVSVWNISRFFVDSAAIDEILCKRYILVLRRNILHKTNFVLLYF